MADAFGASLPLAIAIALSPFPVVAVVLILGTPKARAASLAFLCGWVVGTFVLGSVGLLLANDADEQRTAFAWVLLLLGLLMFGFAAKSVKTMLSDGPPETPGWLSGIETLSVSGALLLGAALATVNPKNVALVLAGAAEIATATVDGRIAALAAFTAVASIGAAVPVGIYFFAGERGALVLKVLERLLIRHSAPITAVVCALVGAKLVGDAVALL